MLCHPRGGGQPQHVEGPDQVQLDDLAIDVKVTRGAVSIDDAGADTLPGAVDDGSQGGR